MLELQRQRQARVRIRMRKRGKVHAGRVMRWIDEAAYVCGTDWTGAEVVTSYVAGIRFYRRIIVGDVIEVTHESFTLDRAASTSASTSPPPIRTAVKLTS